MLVDHADHNCLSVDNRVRGRRMFALSDVPVAVRSPGENVDNTLQRAMPFADRQREEHTIASQTERCVGSPPSKVSAFPMNGCSKMRATVVLPSFALASKKFVTWRPRDRSMRCWSTHRTD